MDTFLLGAATAFWLGILTSISPCPLATNIAAVSYIGKRLGSARQLLASGLLYAAGRTLAYVVLAMLIVSGLMSIPGMSQFLQRYMNRILGPVLIVAGMFLLELLQFSIPGFKTGSRFRDQVDKIGVWGAGLLGLVFALSFCPMSAGLYFLTLIPLSVKHSSGFTLPFLYGLGTGLPVVGFAFLLAFGAKSVGRTYERLKQFEWWAQRVTGVLFIGVGIYYSVVYIFGVQL